MGSGGFQPFSASLMASGGGVGASSVSAPSGRSLEGRRKVALAELLAELGKPGKLSFAGRVVQAVVTDSRRVVPGSLFVARRGLHTDGNYYIEEAISRGAEAVVSEELPGRAAGVPWLTVPDARLAVAAIAQRFYGFPDREVGVIGVTGTNGKTTVTMLVQALLRATERECGLIGTVRYDIGQRTLPAFRTTPEAVDTFAMLEQMRAAGVVHAAMEISSHALEQHRVHGLRVPVAAFLNLTRDHLDYHGTMEAYFEAKARLFDGSLGAVPGCVVLPMAGPWGGLLRERVEGAARVLSFGVGGDFRAEAVEHSPGGTRFRLHWPSGVAAVQTRLLGHYNVDNLLASLALVYATGVKVEEVLPAVADFVGVPGRMERVDAGQPFNVLVDYAHTDDALENALRMLRAITPGRLLLVFGCGGDRDRSKRPLMVQAAQRHADEVWVTADNPRREALATIFKDMEAGVTSACPCHFIADRRRAIGLALASAQAGDAVLIAGKGHEAYQEFAETVVPFDDRQVARELLGRRGAEPAKQ